jgi:SAM-dependent methyltransferase
VSSFEELVADGAAEPVEGWDFSWFEGRATEERPSWGYARLMGERMAAASVALDIETGGGEVLAGIPLPPTVLLATESWAPNVAIAARTLRPVGGQVVRAADDGLPFAAGMFDLVVSRHPVDTVWSEVARVLRPGGTYLSQQVGPGTCIELVEAMTGPDHEVSDMRRPDRHVGLARAAGLDVVDLRSESLRMEFLDVGAIVYFLRKVFWFVPDFTVDGYRSQLVDLHKRIQKEGSFVTHSTRFLIEAQQPATRNTIR